MVDSLMQEPMSFATLSDTDASEHIVTATVPEMEQFGWTTFSAMEQKQTLQTVHTAAGAVTTVATVKTFQFYAPQRG